MIRRNEKGYTVIDIAISIAVIFIFISILSMLFYEFNSSATEIERKTQATYLAINEIEQVKINGIDAYLGMNEESGPIEENVEIQEGFYKTITVMDYTDIPGNEDATSDIVKKVTVKISYMFQAKEQSVEISTIVSKES